MRPTPSTRRREDWPERLSDVVEARRSAPFDWGSNCCVGFAREAVLAMTGTDPLAGLAWSSEAEAEALLQQLGGLQAAAEQQLAAIGAVPCPPGLLQRGDVVLMMLGNQPTVGIWLGDCCAAPRADSLAFVPRPEIIAAWAI